MNLSISQAPAALVPAFVLLALPVLYSSGETTAVFLLELLAASLLLGRMFGFFGRDGKFLFASAGPARIFWYLVPLWLIPVGASVVASENMAASFPTLLKLLALVMLALIAAEDFDKPGWLAGICFSAALAGTFHGVLAVQEYVEGAPMPLTWADPALRAVIRTRCAGIFTDPNIFGAFLAALVPWQICGLALASSAWKNQESRLHAFFGASLLLTGVALLMTFSRGAYLAAIAGIVLSLFFWRPSLKRPWNGAGRIIAIVFFILLIVFFAGPFKYRFISIGNARDMTFSQRTLINKGIFAAAANVPWCGYGLHTFSQVYPRFRCVGGDYPLNAHNEFLQTFVEAGPIAAVMLVLLCLSLWWCIVRQWRNSKCARVEPSAGLTPEYRSWPGGAAAGTWAVFFLHNLSGFSSRMLPTSAFFALAVGSVLAAACHPHAETRPATSAETASGSFTAVRSLGAFFLIAYMLLAAAEARHQHKLDAASSELVAGEVRTATARLSEITAQRPFDPMGWALAARAAEARSDPAAALDSYARAAEINPQEAVFWSERARIVAVASGPAAAMPLMRRAVELDPASEQFRIEAAKLYMSMNMPHEALKELDAALSTSPGFHEVYRIYLAVDELKQRITDALASATPADEVSNRQFSE